MSGREDYYGYYDEVDPYSNFPGAYRGEGEDEVEPWWERFYDERDDYEDYRDEVER